MSWEPNEIISRGRQRKNEKRGWSEPRACARPAAASIDWKSTYREVSAVVASKNPAGSAWRELKIDLRISFKGNIRTPFGIPRPSPIQSNPTTLSIWFVLKISLESPPSKTAALDSSYWDPCFDVYFPPFWQKTEQIARIRTRVCWPFLKRYISRSALIQAHGFFFQKERIEIQADFKPLNLQRNEAGQGIKCIGW